MLLLTHSALSRAWWADMMVKKKMVFISLFFNATQIKRKLCVGFGHTKLFTWTYFEFMDSGILWKSWVFDPADVSQRLFQNNSLHSYHSHLSRSVLTPWMPLRKDCQKVCTAPLQAFPSTIKCVLSNNLKYKNTSSVSWDLTIRYRCSNTWWSVIVFFSCLWI